MLGLPGAGASAWTLWSLSAITLTMIVMTLSGWLLLEAFKHYHLPASFNTVTKDMLGSTISWFSNLSIYFVGAILLYAYITSAGLIVQSALQINSALASVLFVALASAFVWHSTRAVDRISILLIIFMISSFLFSVFGLSTSIKTALLFDVIEESSNKAPFAMAMLPVALTSFGYHSAVSSMRSYYGEEKKAQYAILGGTIVALCFYVIWILNVYGNLPRSWFFSSVDQGGDVDALINALAAVSGSDHIAQGLKAFAFAAILSSFIGVGLGIFDFLADFFEFDAGKRGRTATWLLTFIPPLVLSLLFPFGFVVAIGYAGAIATVWTCIIPAMLAFKSRSMSVKPQGFVVPGGMSVLILVFAFGVVTAVFHMLSMAGALPTLN